MLKCLGVLGAGNKAATEAMTDVLAKVAAGHAAAAPRGAGRRGGGTTGAAVATEAAVTIMRIEPVPTLRSYAVQIMANLLNSRTTTCGARLLGLGLPATPQSTTGRCAAVRPPSQRQPQKSPRRGRASKHYSSPMVESACPLRREQACRAQRAALQRGARPSSQQNPPMPPRLGG